MLLIIYSYWGGRPVLDEVKLDKKSRENSSFKGVEKAVRIGLQWWKFERS